MPRLVIFFFFFFNDTATTEIYTLSLHDALPICSNHAGSLFHVTLDSFRLVARDVRRTRSIRRSNHPLSFPERLHSDRKSTRLNSSHGYISYAVFCLKKKIITQCIYEKSMPTPRV